jgi:hypothetical protein
MQRHRPFPLEIVEGRCEADGHGLMSARLDAIPDLQNLVAKTCGAEWIQSEHQAHASLDQAAELSLEARRREGAEGSCFRPFCIVE